MTSFGTWVLREVADDAAALHGLTPAVPAGREVWHLEVTKAALVLGSAQADSVDRGEAERAAIAVVRRRSGGGAVLMVPGESTWIDLVLPRDDVLWDDDVTRSFRWLGEVWREALGSLGFSSGKLVVNAGGLVRGDFGAAVCFAGVGPGEVVRGSAKVVGLSQRRTRDFARFQCTVHHVWRPDVYRRLLPIEVGPAAALPPVATVDVDPAAVVATLCEVLATV